ncbi:Tryptophan--tRNA ligase, mitochondrial [Strongyloides ratti]|uniref:tryptophan--tRNA ligase n=1 Tax=Strongyloides ratti TaxID=34506 RepID=A0A090L5P6_STRRB|nr:Tryptophan--tRNA ligase, mitochondrial [Strongyloides ratti]CEF65111.1 Tryptophan--tRNA ligase, mitochondrial [Strongyloides ratti]
MKFSLKTLNIISKPKINPRVYFAGIQPTGEPHLGNYLGFIKNFLRIQNEEPSTTKIFLSVVDLHAISTQLFPKEIMRNNIRSMFASLLACGVNLNKTVLFKQSDVLEHTQLFWILSSCQTLPNLQRQPQYKDKINLYTKGDVPLGLLSYPVLQASDILLYKTTHVPVGEDQLHHMSLARNLARKFNEINEIDYFILPDAVLSKAPRVRSLQNPLKKMSKSDASNISRVGIYDTENDIRKKIQKAVTDGIGEIYYDDKERPGISNLLTLLAEFENTTIDEVSKNVKSLNKLQVKSYISDKINKELQPIRERYHELIRNPNEIDIIIDNGRKKASEVASKTLKEVKEIIGFT